ncbi:YCF48-related protein [uncultured Nevskia sp.]|uniref:WD40/YVTN/BNR-like repeat-containing protein n=1 Tax=uncultured Nevskia sp. TaxID=228950 RepID=UPI0025EDBAC6|nr:YCF48-related protein [uncultured Nevskia sp.]
MRKPQRLILAGLLGASALIAVLQVTAQEPAAAATPAVLSTAGPVAKATVERLLLNDATRAGKRIVAVGEHGYAITSDDEGASWQRGAGLRRTMLTGVRFADDKTGWVIGHDGLIAATTDGGASWHEQRFAPDEEEPLLGVYARDASNAIAVGAYGLYLETKDGGITWTERKITEGEDDRHLNAITAFGNGKLAIVGESGSLLISMDAGATWTAAKPPYEGSYFGALAIGSEGLMIFGLRGQAFVSSDAGVTWTAAEGSGPVTLLGGGVGADGSVTLVGSAGTVRISRDTGKTFAPLAPAKVAAYSTALPLDARHALLFGEAGTSVLELAGAAK